MTRHHPAKFSGHERCGSGMFFVVEEHDFTCLLNSLFFLKHMHVMITHTQFHIKNLTKFDVYLRAQEKQFDQGDICDWVTSN